MIKFFTKSRFRKGTQRIRLQCIHKIKRKQRKMYK